MDDTTRRRAWLAEEAHAFEGWSFSHMKNRCVMQNALPWDYSTLVAQYLTGDMNLLDMGTGGGEFLLSLKHPYHQTSVTEAWPPNIAYCNEHLAPLGIQVYDVEQPQDLPMEDDLYDIVINRHSAYCASEVARVLKPGGLFITQQVGGRNNLSLAKRIEPTFEPNYPNLTLENEILKFETAGFRVLYKEEAFPVAHYLDVGALVFFMVRIPWEFPTFSVNDKFPILLELQQELEHNGFIPSVEHRFISVAKKNF